MSTPALSHTAYPCHRRAISVRGAQRGVALAVSLILLVALTIVVLATMSGTRLNEKIASNAQQKAISFEAAESSIGSIWVDSSIKALMRSIPVDQYNDPLPIEPAGSRAALSADFDQTNAAGTALSVDISASVSFQYCGETALPKGSSLNADESDRQLVGTIFDVNGIASLEGSNAESDHIQRGYIMSPKTQRSGSCVTPGV